MKTIPTTTLAVLAMIALGAAVPAHASPELARSKNCVACHGVDKKMVGPAYKDVADKYRNDKNTENMLVQKVIKGSRGTWGSIPMPPNAHVTDAEAHMLVKWILSGAE